MATHGSCGKDTTIYNLNLSLVLCLSGNRLIPSSASISNQDPRSLIQPTASLSRQPYPSPTPPKSKQRHTTYYPLAALIMRASNLLTIFATLLALGTNANPLDLVLGHEELCGFCAIAVSDGATCSNNGNCSPRCCVCGGSCCAPHWVGC